VNGRSWHRQAGRLDAYDADFVRRIKRLAAAGR